MSEHIHIERHIILGLITSTEYLNEVHEIWESKFIQSQTAKRISAWCLEYFEKYNKAPNQDIENIYFEKLKKGDIPEEIAEELEEDILPDLSEEYEREDKFNVDYLLDRTREYFNERNLEIHTETIQSYIDEGEVSEAEMLANSYAPVRQELDSDVILSSPKSLKRVGKAFGEQMKPIVTYPGALGEYMNEQLTRDSFIAFLAPEKRGKSYWLLDLARRGVRQRLNVAFFQAGDMSESQQIRRLGIHLAKKSDLPIYAGKMWEPVKDCIFNQTNECDLKIRECSFGLEGEHSPANPIEAREGKTLDQLKELKKQNPDYRACYNCKKFQHSNWGTAWINEVDVGAPLGKNEALNIFENYFVEKKRNLMISTHPNNTLSVQMIDNKLESWYKKYGFVADLIAIDYADLLVSNLTEHRHKQDAIWKDLRSLSEKRHTLVATATQADAKAYETGLLRLANFSEDKRKYAHVTAMYGLNQDPAGREKEVGIMRINTLVIREGESKGVVHVLQNLKRGQPILTSYW